MQGDPVDLVFEHLADGRQIEALEELDRVLREEPYHGALHALRALIRADLGQLERAAEDARAACEMAPEHPFAHYAAGVVAFRQGAVLETLQAARRARHLAPGYADAALLEARALAATGQWTRVATIAAEVLASEPDNEEAAVLEAVARSVEREGNLDAGAWGELSARFPLSAVARTGSGWTRLTAGDVGEARGEFEQALALEPGLGWAREGLVLSLKARNPVYALLLRFFLWSGRLPQRSRILVVLGGVIGYNVLRRAADTNAELRPFLLPILIAYVAFVALTWLADPLLNLALMARPEGRRLLRPEERRGALLVGACLCLAAGLGVLAALTEWRGAGLSALGVAFSSFAVSAASRHEGRRSNLLRGLAAAAVAFSLLAGLVGSEAAGLCFLAAVLCTAASTWLSQLAPD